MAWLGNSNNRDEYRRTEPNYGRMGYSDHVHHPVILDSNGMKRAIVGYTATQNSQRYEAKTEQVVKYGSVPGFPVMTDHKYSNPRIEGYKDHGVGDKPHTVPRISVHNRPEKNSEFSPKARDEVVHRQSMNPPWNNGYRDGSPPSKDQYRTSGHHDYGKNNNNLPSKTNNYKYHDDEDVDDDDDDDDVICYDGVCFKNPREESKPNYFKDENYNKNEKRKGNGYNPPTYTVPITTKPRSQDHTNNYYESNINNPTATNPPQFNAPPKRDQGNQETIDSTEARRRYGTGGRPGAGTGSGYDEGQYARTIDSKEAARLYNGVFLPN